MAITTDDAAALAIIQRWGGWDGDDPRFEFHVPLMIPISDVINRLAMEGHHSAAGAVLSLLANGKLEATGSYRWKAYRNGHYERDGIGEIPTHRWTVLREGLAECDDPFSRNEVVLRLISGDWKERKEERATWTWRNDQFATAQASGGDWLDDGYFEETYSAADIELRPAPVEVADHASSIPNGHVIEQSRGGAPAKYDWERAVAAIVFHWADEGSWQPASQADVKRRLADWFAELGQYPSDSSLKERARWLFGEFQRRAEEVNNLAA